MHRDRNLLSAEILCIGGRFEIRDATRSSREILDFRFLAWGGEDECLVLSYRRGVAGGLIEVWCPRWFGGAANVAACAAETAALQGLRSAL